MRLVDLKVWGRVLVGRQEGEELEEREQVPWMALGPPPPGQWLPLSLIPCVFDH